MRKQLQLIVILLCVSSMTFAQVSGVVYRDYNGDGTRGTAIPSVEPGVGGIIVKAYNASETLVASTVSDNTGAYTLATSGSVRVEFEIPAALNCVSTAFDFTGFHNDGNNIRFITGSATNVDYGILFPDDYTPNANPFVYVPVYHSGNPLGAGTAASASGFLGYEFNSTSTPTNLKTATASGIGAVWGTAYSKQANKIFTAAFIKRQVGLGPMGTGGIYMLEPTASSFNITQFYNMDANGYRTRAASGALAYGQGSSYTVDANGYAITYNGSNDSESGFPEGLGVVGTNIDRGLPDNMNADCYDPASFDQVGKVGLGDLDISDDGKYLFVMNLYSRKLYRLELNDAYNPTSVVSVNSYAIPSVPVTNGVLRPFAVQYHRGKVYCGAVASGENGGSNIVDGATDLYAYVFEMTDPLGSATFNSTPILSYPLNYQKGYAIVTMNNPIYNKWYPWTNNSNSAIPDPYGETMYPTPMFTNIDFSDRGDMIMDFADRSGHQFGYNNYKYLSTSLAYVGLDIGGDVLIAGRDCGTNAWVLENNGAINSNGTTLTGNSTTNNEGPGNGEFFAQDRATDDYHHETSQGAVAIVPGTSNGIFTVMDPVGVFQGGTSHFSTENGIDNNRTVLYGGSDGEFSKANGLGDIEVAGEEPPIEVGNLVWNDANGDGIQSAGEVGIGNVTLELFCDFDNNNTPDGAFIATVNTNSNGQWYFNESNVADGDCNAAGAQLGLQPNKTYIVRIGSADWTGGAGTGDLALKGLTLLNSTSAGMADKSDNDASLVSSVPQLQFTTGKWGENNHSYDFGFADCIADAGTNISLNCAITSGTIGTAAVSGNTYSWNPTTGLNNASIAQPTASPTVTTTYTLTVNGICTDEVTVTVDYTAPTADAGSTKNLTCTTTSATIGTTAISGNTYSWSPTTGLSNPNIAQPTANPTTTTTYTVTVTGTNGCTATSTVLVDVNKSAPTADAGPTKNLTCTTTSATIGTVAISGNTYSWSPTTALSDANSAQPTANPTTTTTYTVTVTGSNGCTATSSVLVNVNLSAPTADAGLTKNLTCTTTSATIGTTAISGNTYSWSPTTALSDANSAQPTANPTTTTTYTVTVTGANGCTATSSVLVDVNTSAPIADAGSTKNLTCTTTSATIGTTAISGNTYSWSPTTALSDANSAQPPANPTTTTTYTVTVTGANGCTATSSVLVNVNISAPTADAGPTKNLTCTTTSATIGTTAISGNTYSWSPTTGLNDANSAQPTANPTTTTTYTVTVTGANGCTATSSVLVDVNTTPPTVGFTGNMVVCNGSTTSITATGGSSYVWSNGDLTATTNVGVGTYTVTVTGSNGCTNSDVATVNNIQGSIGNYVWIDMNANGVFDEALTTGINGVNVELYKETSTGSNVYNLNQTATTANDGLGNPGYYNFIICESGNYKVKFPLTQGSQMLTTTTTTPITDNNSDASKIDGFSPSFAMDVNGAGSAKDNMTIDAGYYELASLGNYVWNDVNHDGIQDANEVGVAGISVTLYNNAGTPISTTLTDAYGYYLFDHLTPADYTVGFSLPQNYVFTTTSGTSETDATNSDVNTTTGKTTTVTLSSGEHQLNVDAGIYFEPQITATVGNYVWFDVNIDGTQDNTEVGISGVTVSLYNSTGNVVATTITDGSGLYLFTDVAPGNYTIGFTAPVGFIPTVNIGGVSNATNSDANPVNGKTASFTVNAGDHITYVDAGYVPQPTTTASLGDKVWYDVNQNGTQDIGELGVQGVTVTLYQSNGTTAISTTTTDAYGNYIFNNLAAGQYVVGFTNLPINYVLTTTSGTNETNNSDANTSTAKTGIIDLSSGEHDMTWDAGIYNSIPTNTNSIGDYVWNDIDKDGVQDANEQGVAGITVTLFDNTQTPIATTSTHANGLYLFPDLPNGDYSVGFSNLPEGFVFSPSGNGTTSTDSDPNPSTGMTSSVSLTGNTHITTLDAGINLGNPNVGTASLGDKVWYDVNNNGLQDAGEAGVQGVTATLYAQNGTTVLATTITNALGYYVFTGLNAGDYVVGFTNLPAGFTITSKDADTQGIEGEANSDVNVGSQQTDPISLAIGQDKMSVDMGIVPPAGTAALGDFVWYDLNNDGLQTSGEPGVQGVTVTLYDNANTAIANTTTDVNGEYHFVGLTPGTYSVGFNNLPTGYTFTNQSGVINDATNSDANITTGMTATVTLAAGDNNLNLDAGIVSTTVASVGDYVWYDMNHDGIQDANEPGLGGILVTLYDNTNTPVASTITNPDGSYIFTNVTPGTYTMGFGNLPSGMTFTTQESNPNSNTGSNVNPSTGFTPSFTVTAGTHNPTIDAGLTTSPLAGLGNYVWYDNNRDGVQGANETGVAGAIATLYTSNGTTELAHAITNGDGGYSFTNLPAGDYIVGFSNLPNTYEATKSNGTLNDASNSDMNPTTGKTTVATLVAGEYNPNLDAGIMKPTAQLGNYVWNDMDKDGVQDANEVGVAGITVMLYDATNQVVGSTITDGYGYYKFNPLEDGIYSVSFTLPANYVFSDVNQGSDDELDSDVNPLTGWTTTYTLMPGDSNMSVDAGIYFEAANTATVGNFVWYDTNQDGIQDAGEEGISGVTVTLYDNTGATVATVITNSNGFYLFTDVAPGTYTVGFTPPAGLTFSPNNVGVSNPSNSDVIPASGTTATFTVNAGDHITYVDAGLYSLPANLGGLGDKVWYDVNQNGVQDAGESGVPDVTVTLYQSNGTTQLNQTQTDAFGNYIFNNLPQGQYIVGFSNLPIGYTLSPTTGTDSVTNSDANQMDGKTPIIYLSQGQFNMTYDAGIYNTTPSNNNSIGNYVWLDVNKDGIQDNNELGKSGITATLYSSSNVVLATTSTDAAGYYLFPNLPNGDYYVGFSNLPANFVFTQTGAGTSTTDSDPNLVTGMTGTVSLTGNTHDMSLDAGIYRGSLRIGIDASLGDIVWYDMNGNGLQDQGESGVPGVTVTLYESDATTVISTTTTDALGNYIFTNLVEETYVVGFSNLPSGFTISPKNADAQGLNGELNSDVNVGTQQTDAILLGEGEDKLSVDMGIVPPPTSASLGNLVWFDLNNDGLQSSGEPGVQGVGVTLLDNAGNPVQYTTTNGNGEYYFVGLTPDTYSVQFTNLPSGYEFTNANADAAGINGALNSDADEITGSTATVTLAAGDNNLNLDAGIISTTVAAVGDYVWFDADRDGIQDATETGIGGVLVTLYDNTGTPVTSTITGPDGGYIFTNVTPGDYTIGFDNIPDGMEFTQEVGTATDNTNSNADPITGMTDPFTVTPGSYNPTIDAGVTIPATAGLGNYVWLDVNENGLQDVSEPSVAGVVATLYASNGTTVLATAVTDGNGAYSFVNLEEGTYVVGFSNLPLGSVPTQNVGVLNDALNSDMNILTRKTTPVFLPSGTFNPNLDAGIYFGIPVPVHELKANYAVIKDGGLCDVYWYTTDEKNAVNFDIERSLDGINFTSVGSTDAKGNTIGRSIYSFTDNITSISSEPVIYYRIRLNDLDGHSILSNVISVTSDATGGSVIYPSPFTTELTILYPSTGNNELDVLMTDASGRTVRHENKVLENGLNMVRISGLDALAAGQYYIKLRDFNSGETFIHKVSK